VFFISLVTAVPALAGDRDHDGDRFRAKLNGYNEVVGPGSISTTGTGRFTATIDDVASTITYELRYTLEDLASVAHIHFAQRHVGGAVIAFLCGGGGKPACPDGRTTEAVVRGVIVRTDIVGPTAQGIEPGSFEEAVRAIRAGATYANVHSTPRFPSGEIRGQIGGRDGDDD